MKLGELLGSFFSLDIAPTAYVTEGQIIVSKDINLRDLFYECDVAFVVSGACAHKLYIKPEWLEREVIGFYAFQKDRIIIMVDGDERKHGL